jgi:hypothetical protein
MSSMDRRRLDRDPSTAAQSTRRGGLAKDKLAQRSASRRRDDAHSNLITKESDDDHT